MVHRHLGLVKFQEAVRVFRVFRVLFVNVAVLEARRLHLFAGLRPVLLLVEGFHLEAGEALVFCGHDLVVHQTGVGSPADA